MNATAQTNDTTSADARMNAALRENILNALNAFANQRPGLEPANYISGWNDQDGRRAYFRESRSITRDLHDFRALFSAVRWRESIDAAALQAAFRAFSGRLVCKVSGARVELSYCTGQYFPTEYRRAACAVLASALWDYTREHVMPAASGTCMKTTGVGVFRHTDEYEAHDGIPAGDWLRRYFRREFGARMQRRWFD